MPLRYHHSPAPLPPPHRLPSRRRRVWSCRQSAATEAGRGEETIGCRSGPQSHADDGCSRRAAAAILADADTNPVRLTQSDSDGGARALSHANPTGAPPSGASSTGPGPTTVHACLCISGSSDRQGGRESNGHGRYGRRCGTRRDVPRVNWADCAAPHDLFAAGDGSRNMDRYRHCAIRPRSVSLHRRSVQRWQADDTRQQRLERSGSGWAKWSSECSGSAGRHPPGPSLQLRESGTRGLHRCWKDGQRLRSCEQQPARHCGLGRRRLLLQPSPARWVDRRLVDNSRSRCELVLHRRHDGWCERDPSLPCGVRWRDSTPLLRDLLGLAACRLRRQRLGA